MPAQPSSDNMSYYLYLHFNCLQNIIQITIGDVSNQSIILE